MSRTVLLDADIIAYEVAFASQRNGVPMGLERVNEKADERIRYICAEAGGTEPPVLFLTGRTNFRNQLSESKPYKGNRNHATRPFHLSYVRAYLEAVHGAEVTDGFECDDALAMAQTERLSEGDTIIASLDKDLKTVQGWHYSWEIANRPSFGPAYVSKLGYVELVGSKCKGTGMALFYAQLLMGDAVDNIPGLHRYGPRKAYEALKDCKSIKELHFVVSSLYEFYHPDDWESRMIEQGNLLWMVRRKNPDGSPEIWEQALKREDYYLDS